MAVTLDALGQDLYDACPGRPSVARILLTAARGVRRRIRLGGGRSTCCRRAPRRAVRPTGGAPRRHPRGRRRAAIAVPEWHPPSLVVQPLIKGDGSAGRRARPSLSSTPGVDWADGSVVDTTWAAGKRAVHVDRPQEGDPAVGTRAWSSRPIGSQVLLVIPPASGENTLVVVDSGGRDARPRRRHPGRDRADPSATPTPAERGDGVRSRYGSSPALTSTPAAWSRGSTSRTCATPVTRSSWRGATTPRAPTSSPSSTSRRPRATARRPTTSCAAPPSRSSSR